MESFGNPQSILSQVTIKKGSFVVDVGSGVGTYSLPLATLVGPEGTVVAIDIQKVKLDRLYAEAQKAGLQNVHVVWSDAELPNGTKLADTVADVVILTNVFFLIDDKQGLLTELKRILKKGGMVLLVDWTGSFDGIGPHPNRVVPKDTARDMFMRAGFTFGRDINAGAYHYGMIINN